MVLPYGKGNPCEILLNELFRLEIGAIFARIEWISGGSDGYSQDNFRSVFPCRDKLPFRLLPVTAQTNVLQHAVVLRQREVAILMRILLLQELLPPNR